MSYSPNTRTTNRHYPKFLTGQRIAVLVLLLAIAVMSGLTVNKVYGDLDERVASAKTAVAQANMVERGSTFLESVGFTDPVYLGLTDGAAGEGEYPTFRAGTVNGEPIDIWIRTTNLGGLEIQPVGLFDKVASADDLARKAIDAKFAWDNKDPKLKPSTDEKVAGEYEGLLYSYNTLLRFVPEDSYWQIPRDETKGWPRTK